MHFYGTIWRPPYEADSLLIQATAGCTHHACKFCTLYEDLPFRFRMSPLSEIEEDLREAQLLYTDPMMQLSARLQSLPRPPFPRRAFLTGANPFVLHPEKLGAIADMIHRYFPGIETIGCFARVTDIAPKSGEELRALREVCNERNLFLFCDGARLGCAMDAGDTSFEDYGAYCDAFTIGGTKNGLLFGEALVIVRPGLQRGFRHNMKQQGAMLAKGRLLGVQFNAVLEGGLYQELAAQANRMGRRLTAGLKALGVPLAVESPSNQVFAVLPDNVVSTLPADFTFESQGSAGDGRTCIRLVTSWQSSEADVDVLLARLGELLK